MTSEGEIERFVTDPSEFFGHSLTKMMTVPRETLSALQMGGLTARFRRLRGSLPMLDKLADAQGIDSIHEPDDLLPLLFSHEIYKSYPASLLEKRRYRALTDWLNKLTTLDLSKVDVSACASTDDWMLTLSRESPLAVVHTSGTSGRLSFLPWTKAEWIRFIGQHPVMFFQRFGEDAPAPSLPMNIPCIFPYFRSGGISHTVLNDALVKVIAGSEERFHAAYPGRLSADLLLLAARRRAAESKGQLDRLEISPELAARRAEFETQQRGMPQHLIEFFSTMRTTLAGKQVFIEATSNLLHSLAQNGLQQGMRNIFSPDSVILTGGGNKGVVIPKDWQDTVKAFFGTERLSLVYGMSEMAGLFTSCQLGSYHAPPWIIPFVLDPDTGQALPRRGRVKGRFAFYDLLPDTRWGGFVTGDEVTMEWDEQCPCGRTTPYLGSTIERLSEKRANEGEEKISCAATPAAYAEALDFLTADTL